MRRRLIVLITLVEFSQILLPARTFSLSDLFCGYAGVLCFGQAAVLLAYLASRTSGSCFDS